VVFLLHERWSECDTLLTSEGGDGVGLIDRTILCHLCEMELFDNLFAVNIDDENRVFRFRKKQYAVTFTIDLLACDGKITSCQCDRNECRQQSIKSYHSSIGQCTIQVSQF
jgi:hypothetical protein